MFDATDCSNARTTRTGDGLQSENEPRRRAPTTYAHCCLISETVWLSDGSHFGERLRKKQ
jgi:hypothetical protein